MERPTGFLLLPSSSIRRSALGCTLTCVVRNGGVVVVRSSKGLWHTPLVALSAALVLGTLLTGCTLVDTVDKRADFMNESVTRFRNQGILRNIVRSARDEPLSFAALSQIEGHNTSTNTFPTFPSIDWNPWVVGGTNSTSSSYNVSSDFTLNPIDDSASHAALLNPLDAATIALFSQRSGYQTNLLYLLFFDKIRIADAEGRVLSEFNRVIAGEDDNRICMGDPKAGFCGSRTMLGYTLLAYLNLRFNLEKGAITGQSSRPRAQICFERGGRVPGKWSDLGLVRTGGKIAIPARARAPDGQAVSRPSYCDEEGTWLPATSAEEDFGPSPASRDKSRSRNKGIGANYVIYDDRNKVWIELTTSSAWGIYQFLGTLAEGQLSRNRRPVRLVQPGYTYDADELIVLNITKGAGDCFVEAEMDDRNVYCVPNGPSSRLTRIYFTFLQQLTAMQRSIVSSEPRLSRNVRGIQ
jgi:hypothetical protein